MDESRAGVTKLKSEAIDWMPPVCFFSFSLFRVFTFEPIADAVWIFGGLREVFVDNFPIACRIFFQNKCAAKFDGFRRAFNFHFKPRDSGDESHFADRARSQILRPNALAHDDFRINEIAPAFFDIRIAERLPARSFDENEQLVRFGVMI